ncbi:hypothetical protein KJ628_05980 [Patescibacteria group bacterium]|nr:hypothetical protein [Patescibacteria group bacterium]
MSISKQIRREVFETNSSSSHSLTIDTTIEIMQKLIPNNEGNIVVDENLGYCQFGWEFESYHDVGSKIIYAYLQAESVNNRKWIQLLTDVVKEHSGAKEVIWKIVDDYDSKHCGYIDHQSCGSEDDSCQKMFKNKKTLKQFLFNKSSYVRTGNDNG